MGIKGKRFNGGFGPNTTKRVAPALRAPFNDSLSLYTSAFAPSFLKIDTKISLIIFTLRQFAIVSVENVKVKAGINTNNSYHNYFFQFLCSCFASFDKELIWHLFIKDLQQIFNFWRRRMSENEDVFPTVSPLTTNMRWGIICIVRPLIYMLNSLVGIPWAVKSYRGQGGWVP